MTDANSFRSLVFVLLIFGVIYFAALLKYELKKWISNKKKKKETV